MKYLSIDIETTGLDPNVHQILEMAAILDDTEHPEIPVTNLPYFRALVLADNYTVDPYCAQLHSSGLWQEIQTAQKVMNRPKQEIKVELFSEKCEEISKQFTGLQTVYCPLCDLISFFIVWVRRQETLARSSVFCAGKNFGAFDLQFIKAQNETCLKLPFKHRYFDPGCMYYTPGDTEIPSLPTCLSRAGLEPTNLHTALGDAMDVIRVLRPKISLKGAL